MKGFAILLLALFAASCARPLPPGVIELTYASPYGPRHPFSVADRRWIDHVEAESGGSLRIRPIWSGALLSSAMSMEELRHGVADIGLITPIYVRGGTHLLRTQTGFYSGADTIDAQLALFRCLDARVPQISRELDGLRLLAAQGGTLPGILTAGRPVRSLADLAGMRLRAPTELLPVLDALGADPIELPMSEVYSALAKGVIDGVIAPPDTYTSLHFGEVTDYYTDLSIPRGAYPARAMGEAAWERLSPRHRRIIAAARPLWEAAMREEIEAATALGMAEARASGVRFARINASDQRRFDRLYQQVARENAQDLQRYGIDGLRAFEVARASIDGQGVVRCEGET